MKIIIFISLILLCFTFLHAQNPEERRGTVTYKSSQTTYIKFETTEGILVGDTLFIRRNNRLSPAILVQFISSRSAAGLALNNNNLGVNDAVIVLIRNDSASVVLIPEDSAIVTPEVELTKDSILPVQKNPVNGVKSHFTGRLSLQSYSGINNYNSRAESQRWRYSLLLDADRISGSDFSFSNYMIFTYKTNDWNLVKDDPFKAFRVYEFSLKYNLSETDEIIVGRHLNRRLSNIGSLDGIQYQASFSSFFTGLMLGSRPSTSDLGFDLKLLQYGAFIGRVDSIESSYIENTIALMQQTNNARTDRRFFYFQHANDVIPRINLFLSSEFDLYERERRKEKNTFSLTSLFLSARYSPARWLALNLSYDARKNVIYYETFKNFTDSLIENEMRQGFRFGINIRPFNYLFAGFNAGYRYQNDDLRASRNFNFYSTFSRVPFLGISSSISFTYIASSFIDGNIYGLSFGKDLPFNNSNISFTYRKTDYKFPYSKGSLTQDNVLIDFTTRLIQNFYFSISWDGTFENERSQGRILLDLTSRF